jgi:hypothetical protein
MSECYTNYASEYRYFFGLNGQVEYVQGAGNIDRHGTASIIPLLSFLAEQDSACGKY